MSENPTVGKIERLSDRPVKTLREALSGVVVDGLTEAEKDTARLDYLDNRVKVFRKSNYDADAIVVGAAVSRKGNETFRQAVDHFLREGEDAKS